MNPARVGLLLCFVSLIVAPTPSLSAEVPIIPINNVQPLEANVARVMQAMELLGAPIPESVARNLRAGAQHHDPDALQFELDSQALFIVTINPESRVKTQRGPGKAVLQQAGFVPVIVKVVNQSGVTKELRIVSAQAGQVYAGMSELSAERMQRKPLKETTQKEATPERFLELSMHTAPPMSSELSGFDVEYAIALIYSSEAGKREATIGFEIGSGSQDLGFRGEVSVLFEIRPAISTRLKISDYNGEPTTARLTFRDRSGHIFPPQAKRLAPDFYFQPQIYRHDGDTVLLPPGEFNLEYTRGPEYKRLRKDVQVKESATTEIAVKLQRWINPMEFGFYCGDHHIHGAGCAHYTSPTEGVKPEDMFLQVSGEALNVGCILTWGPCYDYQRRFFTPSILQLSAPFTVMKYDLEISGFGSQALGHVCLLNLKDQTYPGSDGTKSKGWPTWTTPVLRWAKAQGAVTGYAHSASGLEINSKAASARLIAKFDANKDGLLSATEAERAILPLPFAQIEMDGDGQLTAPELTAAHDRAAEQLPNFAVPEMNGVGAMEVCVSVAMGACDFISAMDTPRIAEWNMWYHLLNCGFPLKVSGETDFPCMSGERVGQGRVYVQLGRIDHIDFTAWCNALAKGRSYVSDGFAHALDFSVEDIKPGFGDVTLKAPGKVKVRAKVAFAPETPRTVAQGTLALADGKRFVGDTVTLHASRSDESVNGGTRLVEIVVNGHPTAHTEVPADGKTHDLIFDIDVFESSWIGLRQFPQLHTNPINVLVGDKPIRASQKSALWCIETIEQLWRARERSIVASEREEARKTFDEAIEKFRRIASESSIN
ncbi:MAG TPA: CehA/McbA family metallohydrolase [Verrucomicrobiae bacterium]